MSFLVPKIADFGLARCLDEAVGQTTTGAILGTPSYMAPEQAAGQSHAAGPAADIYALGAILYEALTGRPPFRGASALETIRQVTDDEPVPPRRLQPTLPPDLETICLKCLRKAPKDRYASAAALAEDLRRLLHGEPIQARPTGAWERGWKWARRKPAFASLVVLGAEALLVLFAGMWWHQHTLSQEVQRANERETEARRQKSQALANFRKGHETLDAVFLTLDGAPFRAARDPGFLALYQGLGKSILRYYYEVLQEVDDLDPETRLSKGMVLVYAGRMQLRLEDKAAAERDFQQARHLLEALVADDATNPAYLYELSYCSYWQGVLFQQRGRPEEARRDYHRAAALLTATTGTEEPLTRKERQHLAMCHSRLAEVYLGPSEQYPQLERHAAAAAALWSRLAQEEPANELHASWLGKSLQSLAFLFLVTQRWDPLDSVARQAETAMQPLIERSPLQYPGLLALLHLGEIYRHQAHALAARGQHQAAVETLTRAVQVLERVLRQEPAYQDGRMTLAGIYRDRAWFLEQAGQIATAFADWDLAVQFASVEGAHGYRIERATARLRNGEVGRAAAEAKEVAELPKLNGASLFELACVFGRAADAVTRDGQIPADQRAAQQDDLAGQALACLRRCQAAGGLKDAMRLDWVKTRQELASLRTRPDFIQLLRELDGPGAGSKK